MRDLNALSPLVRPEVDAFLAACASQGLDILVTCTRRTMQDQAALYAQGRTTPGRIVTNAKPGQSAHNYGLAIDIVPIVNGKPDWSGDDATWKKIGAIGMANGLEWLGAPHSKFIEQAHFQMPNWQNAVAGASEPP